MGRAVVADGASGAIDSNTKESRASKGNGERTREPYNDWYNDIGFDANYEERTPVELAVKGTIPAYAAGTLYRTGPGGYKVKTNQGKTFSMSHWFDGFSEVHRFQIKAPETNGGPSRVLYNSRFNIDERLEQMRKTGKFEDFSFGQKRDPCQSYFKKAMSMFIPPEKEMQGAAAANVGVTLSVNMPGLSEGSEKHASGINTLIAKTDANAYKKLDPETLEPVGVAHQQNLHPSLKGPLSAAHAKSDPKTGDIYNFNLDIRGPKSAYRIFHVSASTGKTDILATIQAPPAYIHSIFLSSSYVILCIWNSHMSAGGISMLWNKNILDSIAPFAKDTPAKWYVIDRKHGKGLIATYESPPFFSFHTINAFEETTETGATDIVADLSAYENLDILHHFYYNNILSTSPDAIAYRGGAGSSMFPTLRRYRLAAIPKTPVSDTKKAELVYQTPKSSGAELPTMNPTYMTRPHRYTYGCTDRGESTLMDGLIKYDSETQSAIYWNEHGHSPGEPIFVPNPEGRNEDDGVLLSVILDGYAEKSYLLCLDARDLTEVGRAMVGGPVGFGFHGVHVPHGVGNVVEY